MHITSPLTYGPSSLLYKVPTADIEAGYRESYGIDVSEYFKGLDHVSVHRCKRTGFKFYYPLGLAGRADLYEQLESFDWNYKAAKWEYTEALTHVHLGSRLLDVGCGEGAFLKLCQDKGVEAAGLELNPKAAEIGKKNGHNIIVQSIGDHTDNYDVVTSFQVLEHIADPRIFLRDCLRALRPGGKLIIGVPNNGGFIKHDRSAFLNMPPHHMGLWTERSLTALQELYPITLMETKKEPLAELDWYASVQVRRFLGAGVFQRVYYRLGLDRFVKKLIAKQSRRIAGHTILVVYQKKW